MSALDAVVDERSVIICCGSGGVGKTTAAAALAVASALRGRNTCVVTIDPARRLADALGASGVGNEPHEIAGPWPGRLSVVMLDARTTFDELVGRYARDPDQAARILANHLYRNLASVLSGTQEYMATEKLFELHEQAAFDLVVVDTPPTRRALEFLDAPRRVERFLDNRIFKVFVTPGTSYRRAASLAGQLVLRSIARVAGAEIVDDTLAFFGAFQGMEQGFRDRAARVERLLAERATGFVLIAAPRRDAIDDARFFVDELGRRDGAIDALIVNRVHPAFGTAPDPGPDHDAPCGAAWRELVANLADLEAVARRERGFLADLVGAVAPAPVVQVPFLDGDVHDVEGLLRVVRHLIG
ncbi:MAG: ArsA family ATPase [Acidimicrobiales bacterium]